VYRFAGQEMIVSGGRRVTADGGGLNFYTTSVTEELQAQEKSVNQSISQSSLISDKAYQWRKN